MGETDRQDPVLFDALLYQHRSMDARTLVWIMGVFALIGMAVGVVFLLHGAWPVFGFFGLDVLALYLVFRWSHRTGRAYEQVRLTARDVTIRRVDHRGCKSTHRLPPHWLRINVEAAHKRGGGLALATHGERVVIGRFLTAGECEDLAASLRAALTRLRTPVADAAD